MARKMSKESIRRDLLAQLRANGIPGKCFEDLIEDYMDLWITKNLLLDDIKTRGVSVRYDNGGGQRGHKKMTVWIRRSRSICR